jgi:kynureninase
MPSDAPARMAALLQRWRFERRRGWDDGDWLELPRRLGAAVAPLVGAAPQDVLVGDSTSVNLYKLLRHALNIASPRKVIVVEAAVFPTNRYVAEGIAQAGRADLRVIESPAALPAALAGNEVAVVALSHVDYRSSTRLDMSQLNRLAHGHGATVLWDLSHSAGAVAVDLRGSDADYAVASGYKYLCGGPGAPAMLYVHPRWQSAAWPAICGWMGHQDTFAFNPSYTPAPDIGRQLAGTPAVIANAAWSAAADLWRLVDPKAMDDRHRSLSGLLIALLDQECAGLGLEVSSPREHRNRGGHVAVRMTDPDADLENLGSALAAANVVASTRKPDSLRFGVHPITTSHVELWDAVQRLRDILASGRWRRSA